MLVLSRLRDETIMIGDEVEITVVDIRGDKVRLGITAPPRVVVHRKEVYDAIKAENERASQALGEGLAEVIPRDVRNVPVKRTTGGSHNRSAAKESDGGKNKPPAIIERKRA